LPVDCPQDANSYDLIHLVGDVVGLMKALESTRAVLVGQDWGTIVVYYNALMRPELVRGVLMMCSPPTARGAVRPSDAMKQIFKGLNFYQSSFATTEAGTEIMRDLHRFLLGVFYSTSGYCPVDKQWRWAWKPPETFSETYIVPATRFLRQREPAVDHTHRREPEPLLPNLIVGTRLHLATDFLHHEVRHGSIHVNGTSPPIGLRKHAAPSKWMTLWHRCEPACRPMPTRVL
jgi:pimeloyl-ACP methyl ester carboxylesterase